MNKRLKKPCWSVTSVYHAWKLIGRSLLFLAALVSYIISTVKGSTDGVLGALENHMWVLAIIWAVLVAEMLLRFFPSSVESMGCQKQFKKNFKPTDMESPNLPRGKGTALTLISWLILNGGIAALYFTGIIDASILILISLFYSVCDIVCILLFCPFQTWFMKNKCCGSCRIYNWDYAMMFTPIALVPHPYTLSLFGISVVLLITWEVFFHTHPERFAENTNATLACENCTEKLCHHKKQLVAFLRKNRELIAKYLKEREKKTKTSDNADTEITCETETATDGDK